MDTDTAQAITLVIYDRQAVYAMLRDWSTARLRDELAAGRFGVRLVPAERAELEEHLAAWAQRALGALALRDALLVDGQRGPRVFNLLCAAMTRARAVIPPELLEPLPSAPADLEAPPAALAGEGALRSLVTIGSREGLTFAVLGASGAYPLPADLERLPSALPPVRRRPSPLFEPPSGWRRRIAALLALAGVTLLAMPLLLGHIPDHPARAPLALLTLALLIGIRAGPAGFAGSLCIWLVANLPGFRHGSSLLAILWPALPLIGAGLGLLWLDPHVRAMWDWLRRQLAGGKS